ncbi:phage Gp37/Gp68 family protein [Cereibacter sphaeroides]|uniref:phage Gp37/Gp68 family protein n=1 Tax=Cereibacter sphaeroides TaxID=1063 RepID=UPI000F53D828|nr:phage Gp37/Gp68 family protein [Cereibacter sphaeroides]AZB63895.1 phage Gp37/Gp68 family protein [Cereibacter sphaeroides]AZB68183.1 phage Gp37/Gp68 family protein [Cereibacter sphaeroides]
MAETSTIEWTDATWNPITGCTLASPGCQHCYAADLAATRLSQHPSRAGLTRRNAAGVAAWTGEVRLNEQWLDQPLRWRRPRRIFVCAHADLFHEAVPDEWIDRVFAVMALAPQHTFQVLTKRAARMREYVSKLDIYDLEETDEWRDADYRVTCDDDPNGSPAWHEKTAALEDALSAARTLLEAGKPLPNVWLGVSAEDKQRADERIPDLLATPAAVRFGSFEPLLGQMDLTRWMPKLSFYMARCGGCGRISTSEEWGADEDDCWCQHCYSRDIHEIGGLDWIIVGGESGRHARPMHPDWARSLRDQAQAAGVPFLFKQHGEWIGVPDLRNLTGGDGPGFGAFDHCQYDTDHEAVRVGKRAAGRLLDGRTWDGMPEVAHG